MAEAFKHLINRETVARASRELKRAWPAFDQDRFHRLAGHGLQSLEFKARAMQVADALESCLPGHFDDAVQVIETALAPPIPCDARGEPVGLASNDETGQGLSGWVVWSLAEFVARRGMDDLPRAMDCLHALTQRFSAEFAIRPLIARHPDAVFAILARWVDDPSIHVRRLVSEGSRPRLPWSLRLQALVGDPSPALPLLRGLQDDPSAYVRRSVANHLNDIAKDHPDLVADWVRTHLPGASPQRQALLRHASRGLIKQGHAGTLAAWDIPLGFQGRARLTLSAPQVAIGEAVRLTLQLSSADAAPQPLLIDYIVHHARPRNRVSSKVFKGWKLVLPAGGEQVLTKTHHMRPTSTRTLYPGDHRIEVQINGASCDQATFQLTNSLDPVNSA